MPLSNSINNQHHTISSSDLITRICPNKAPKIVSPTYLTKTKKVKQIEDQVRLLRPNVAADFMPHHCSTEASVQNQKNNKLIPTPSILSNNDFG